MDSWDGPWDLHVGVACTIADNKEVFIDQNNECLWIQDQNDHQHRTAVKICKATPEAISALINGLNRLIIHT